MLEQAAEETEVCKCCGGHAVLYGVVDFHKNCEQQRKRNVLTLSGIPVYYHRCSVCGFIFTTCFDHFTKEDFSARIYNADYVLVDPDYVEARPKYLADLVRGMLVAYPDISILDYGAGTGLLCKLLRQSGFRNVTAYDPFLPDHSAKPGDLHDCVLSFEVLEHSVNPQQTLQEINDLLKPDGVIVFSTLTQPPDIDVAGLGWWYVAPRNGHISIYSVESLQVLAKKFNFRLAHCNSGLHSMYRAVPDFARNFIQPESGVKSDGFTA